MFGEINPATIYLYVTAADSSFSRCEIVPPFHFIPKRFLEKTCSAVIQSTLTILLKAFLSQLRTDFEYWSTSLEYRQERAERATISTSD